MTGEEYTRIILNHLATAYLLNDEKIQEVLPRFLDTLLIHLGALSTPLEQENLADLGKAGHTLKGALLNLGLTDLADIAYTIEKKCNAGDTDVDYHRLVEQLQTAIHSFAVR